MVNKPPIWEWCIAPRCDDWMVLQRHHREASRTLSPRASSRPSRWVWCRPGTAFWKVGVSTLLYVGNSWNIYEHMRNIKTVETIGLKTIANYGNYWWCQPFWPNICVLLTMEHMKQWNILINLWMLGAYFVFHGISSYGKTILGITTIL